MQKARFTPKSIRPFLVMVATLVLLSSCGETNNAPPSPKQEAAPPPVSSQAKCTEPVKICEKTQQPAVVNPETCAQLCE